MKKYKWLIVALQLLLLLVLFNWSVVKKEQTLSSGTPVLLALAPVDPRSLMQGDYMRLNYAMSREVRDKIGYFVVHCDSNRVASFVRVQKAGTPLHPGELLIRYRAPDLFDVHIGAESYFFEEGKAEYFSQAKYGGLRVTSDGTSILTGLYDEHFRLLKP